METSALRHAVRRTVIHALFGCAVTAALLLSSRLATVAGLGALAAFAVCVEVVRFCVPSANNWLFARLASLLRGEEKRRPSGATYLVMACLVTALAFQRDIAAAAMLFVSLGDPAATLIGIWQGRVRVGGRSILGNVTCLVVCLACAALLAYSLDGLSLTVALVGAISASVFQAIPLRLNDNVIIPVGSAVVMTVMVLAAS
ncbi:MAG: diacylglycerol/polyprenol kinase family protein [Chloroflexota bacterium]